MGMAEAISPVTGRYITIEVDEIRYRVFYLERGTGRPIVCQHTAGCHNHQWMGLLEDDEFTDRYRVIAYDLPRHGKSDPPENREWWKEEYRLTSEFTTAFIVTLCDALELDDPIFMGSSTGGNIALQIAHRRPDRFGGVIALEACDYTPGFFVDWWRHPEVNVGSTFASICWDLASPLSPESERRRIWFHTTQGSEVCRGDLHLYSVDHDLRGRLGEIDTTDCPLVMMTGNYDWATTPEDSERAARQIPGAEFIEMTGLGHFPMAENYPLFRTYLARAFELIEQKSAGAAPVAAHSEPAGDA